MIGVFGDSFADSNPSELFNEEQEILPWPLLLGKIANDKVISYASSGTSIWYSYKKFIASYKKFDRIVFCYSEPSRWPNINEMFSPNFNLHHVRIPINAKFVPDELKDTANILINAYPILHDLELDKFLFKSIFDSVNKICTDNNIQLVNILSFEGSNNRLNIDIFNTENSLLINLARVSINELLRKNHNEEENEIHRRITEEPDRRFCHLSPHNNKVLANIVYENFAPTKTFINLVTDSRFSRDINDLRYLLELP